MRISDWSSDVCSADLALAGYGATWVRLVYDKWTPARRDFLIGDADHYDGLIAADLATLKQEIARAHRAGLKTVGTPLSLPGLRWIQNNDGRYDGRLWRDKRPWRTSGRAPCRERWCQFVAISVLAG